MTIDIQSVVGDETLRGGAGDDLFAFTRTGLHAYGGTGDDRVQDEGYGGYFDGGEGTDTYAVAAASISSARLVDERDPGAGVLVTFDSYTGTAPFTATLLGTEWVERYDPATGGVMGVDLQIVTGTAGDDGYLEGEYGQRSFVAGGDGHDFLEGSFLSSFNGGGDTLIGGAGDDTMRGQTGAWMDGGTGQDVIESYGDATVLGGAGDDQITIWGGYVHTVSGGAGADVIDLFGGQEVRLTADTVGEHDGDTIYSFSSETRLVFASDTDVVSFTVTEQNGGAVVTLDEGGDGTTDARFTLEYLGDPQVTLVNDSRIPGLPAWSLRDVTPLMAEGSEGDDVLDGAGGNDTLTGLGGADIIVGQEGDDLIDAGDGDDRIYRGYGDDTVFGGAGSDRITIGLGDDEVHAGDGDDVLALFTPGGNSHSTADGGAGDDVIELSVYAGWDTTVAADGDGVLFTTDYTMLDDVVGTVRTTGFETLTVTGLYARDDPDGPVSLRFEGDLSDLLGPALAIDAYAAFAWDVAMAIDASGSAGATAFAMTGGTRDDALSGGMGADTLDGGAGNDVLAGGAGADLIEGGTGADAIYGDGGAG